MDHRESPPKTDEHPPAPEYTPHRCIRSCIVLQLALGRSWEGACSCTLVPTPSASESNLQKTCCSIPSKLCIFFIPRFIVFLNLESESPSPWPAPFPSLTEGWPWPLASWLWRWLSMFSLLLSFFWMRAHVVLLTQTFVSSATIVTSDTRLHRLTVWYFSCTLPGLLLLSYSAHDSWSKSNPATTAAIPTQKQKL